MGAGEWRLKSRQISSTSPKKREVAPIDDSDVIQREEKVIDIQVLNNSKPTQVLI